MKRRAAVLTTSLVIWICPGVVSDLAAQSGGASPEPSQSPKDSFVASWQVDPAPVADGSSGLSVDWIRRTAGGRVFTAGGSSWSVGQSSWRLGRVGAAVSPASRVTLSAHASLGAGDVAGAPFDHRTLRGDLTIRATPSVSATVGDEYISIANAHGHLVRTSAGIRASSVAAVDVTLATSAGGNLNTTFAVARLDVAMQPVAFFGGAAYGRTTPEVLALTGTSAGGSQDLRQGFAGISVPVRRAHLRVSIDVLNHANVTRRTLTMAIAVPVGR